VFLMIHSHPLLTLPSQMRPLAKTDLSRAHLSVLSVLTSAPDVSEVKYAQAFAAMQSCSNTYFTLVIVSRTTDTIVGAGTVFMEQKFTRNLGKVGHIEDIAVDKSMQGRKLGLRIINALTGISEALGSYKTILNCSDDNVGKFYFFFVLLVCFFFAYCIFFSFLQ